MENYFFSYFFYNRSFIYPLFLLNGELPFLFYVLWGRGNNNKQKDNKEQHFFFDADFSSVILLLSFFALYGKRRKINHPSTIELCVLERAVTITPSCASIRKKKKKATTLIE